VHRLSAFALKFLLRNAADKQRGRIDRPVTQQMRRNGLASLALLEGGSDGFPPVVPV
jgi:hypothetical protein